MTVTLLTTASSMGKSCLLEHRSPGRMFASQKIAAGLHLGFAEATGCRPRFHALGAGTLILLPLLGFWAIVGLIQQPGQHSADQGRLFFHDNCGLCRPTCTTQAQGIRHNGALAQWKLLMGLLLSALQGVPGNVPFKINKAKIWRIGEGKRALTPTDLWAPSPLAEHVPLLAMPRNAALRKQAGLARIAHNHWVLRRLEAAIQRRSRTRTELCDWIDTVVERVCRGRFGIGMEGCCEGCMVDRTFGERPTEIGRSGR